MSFTRGHDHETGWMELKVLEPPLKSGIARAPHFTADQRSWLTAYLGVGIPVMILVADHDLEHAWLLNTKQGIDLLGYVPAVALTPLAAWNGAVNCALPFDGLLPVLMKLTRRDRNEV